MRRRFKQNKRFGSRRGIVCLRQAEAEDNEEHLRRDSRFDFFSIGCQPSVLVSNKRQQKLQWILYGRLEPTLSSNGKFGTINRIVPCSLFVCLIVSGSSFSTHDF